ncbi:MAG: PolC-type DNA polymerase III [Bacillota bacterium]|nr:PolC-type DNA polymerase III [Bacillota bacterium]
MPVGWLRVEPSHPRSGGVDWLLGELWPVLPEEERRRLAPVQVVGLRLAADGSEGVVELSGGDPAWNGSLVSWLERRFPGFGRWRVEYRNLSPEEAYPRLVQAVSAQNRALGPLLRAARPEWSQPGCLELHLANASSRDWLRDEHAEGLLAREAERLLGRPVEIRLVVDESAEEEADPEEAAAELVREALEALHSRAEGGGGAAAGAATEEPGWAEGQLLLGRAVAQEPVRMAELGEEEADVAVEGEILSIQGRELKNGRWLYELDLSDGSDSLTVRCFLPGRRAERFARLEPGLWLRVHGRWALDRAAGEPRLGARDVQVVAPRRRRDLAPEKRVELHCHTRMSAMDAVSDATQLIRRAAEWGHPAIAVTDHGVVQSFPEAYEAGKKYGIKILYGMEAYLQVDESDLSKPYNHAVVIARDQEGLHALYELVTRSHLESFHRFPRIPKSLLASRREHLLIGTACERGELFRAILAGAGDEELERIASFYDYLEVQPLANDRFLIEGGRLPDEEALRQINRRIVELGERLGKPVCATSDCHFVEPEDGIYRNVLHAAQGYDDSERESPLYFHTTEEMLAEFAYLGEERCRRVVVEGPQQVAALCSADILPVPEGLHAPELEGAAEELQSMATRRAHELYGDPLPEIVRERLEYEIRAIVGNGFASLYMIAQRLVRKSLEDGYLVGSRGSVGSSLVATMLGITEVNPLPPHYRCPSCRWSDFPADPGVASGFDLPRRSCPRCGAELAKDGHDIPFATFMGFHGDKVPDIDLNFSGEYQPRIHRYTEELLGEGHVFRAGTISTIAERTAFGFVRAWAEQTGRKPREAEVRRLVRGCSGVRRTTGQHPGGLMVVPRDDDILRYTPLQHPADDRESGTVTTHFDYHSISSRLVKLDLLGHDDPTVIRMLEDLTGVDAHSIPFDDPATLALFSGLEPLGLSAEELGTDVGSLGLPEFGTRFVRGMLSQTRPRSFAELVRISGLSHGTDVWNNNAQELVASGRATLQDVISTRDDIMLALIRWGLEREEAFRIMEQVRKGKGLKPSDEEAMRRHGVPDWFVESCQKISYLFPKAHAVAYVIMAFRIAWFKVHHPAAFYATYFSVRADDFDAAWIGERPEAWRNRIRAIEAKGNEASVKEKNQVTILEVAVEMALRGIRFLPIDLERSDRSRFLVEEGALRPPFVAIQGLGARAAEAIVAAREEAPFLSREDLQRRARLSRAVMELLEKHGVLAGLPLSDQMVLF